MVVFCAITGYTAAESPRMRRIFPMFDPRTFPMAISEAHLIAAIQLVKNSGMLVPQATIVSPMMRSDIPRRLANAEDPFTRMSAAITRITRPRMIESMESMRCGEKKEGIIGK